MLRHGAVKRVLVGLCCMVFIPSLGCSFELTLGVGSRDSFSYFAGKLLCRSIDKYDPGVACRVVASDNFTDNLTNLQNGSLDLALANSKIIYDAFHGEGVFRFVALDYSQLRLLMPLYRIPLALLVRRDARIQSFADLHGKKLNAGKTASLEEIVMAELVRAQGWGQGSFSLYQNLSTANAQDFIALHNGSVQAMLHVGMHPDSKLVNSLANKQTRLVGVRGKGADSLLAFNSGFSRGAVPADRYEAFAADIETLALEMFLVTSADADNETVALVLEAIADARKKLSNAHPALLKERVDIETLKAGYLHPHPEAVLFFQVNRSRF